MLMEVLSMLLIPPRPRLVVGWMLWAFAFLLLAGCQASVSAEGGSASTEHVRKVNTPKRTTVIEETWTNAPGGVK